MHSFVGITIINSSCGLAEFFGDTSEKIHALELLNNNWSFNFMMGRFKETAVKECDEVRLFLGLSKKS